MSAIPDPRWMMIAAVTATVALVTGTMALIALSGDRATNPVNGAYGAISCAAPSLPGMTISVQTADSGDMMMGQAPMRATLVGSPVTVPAGRISFAVSNIGVLVHELVVLPLPIDGPGTRPPGADGKIDESQSLGEASRSCGAGVGDGIAPGSTGWTTVNLKAGRYELACDQPWHYAAGMFDVLTVT